MPRYAPCQRPSSIARGTLAALAIGALAAVLADVASHAIGSALAQSPAPRSRSSESSELAAPVRRTVLRVLTETDYPPFNYLDEDGTLVGLNVDLARTICLELAATCDIKVKPWDQLIPALKRGEADAVMSSHAVTAQNLREVDFTDRYYHTPGRFVARKGSAVLDITPEGLEGKSIAVARATAHEAFLRAFFRDIRIQTFANVELARDAIITGAADLLFDDGVSLVFWLNGTASKACCEFRGGAFVEPRFFGDGVGIAVRKTEPELKAQLNASLRRVRASGRLEELLLRYFPLKAY